MALENIFKTGHMLKVNLQAFAEETPPEKDDPNDKTDPAEPEGNEKDEKTGTGSDKPEGQEKTLTQEEANRLITRESRKNTEKMLKELGIEDFDNAKEGMEKFREWQESQKTEREKEQEALEAAQNNVKEYESKAQQLEYENAALRADVNPDDVDDVTVLAERRIKADPEKDIATAMKEVVDQYPQFKKEAAGQDQNTPHFLGGSHKSDNKKTDDPFAAKLAKYQNK